MTVLDFEAMARREPTLIEAATAVAITKTNSRVKAWRLAADALVLPVMLAEAKLQGAAADGGWPTQAEFAAYWSPMHRRTAERYWARYRELFGPGADPRELAAEILARYPDRVARGEQAFVFGAERELLPVG